MTATCWSYPREGCAVPDDGFQIGAVLAEVRDMGPVTVAEIAAQTGVSESSVRRHLAELESSGLIESDDYQRRARVFMPA
jgi:predicted ArsR family transcriptional regulator